MLRENECGKARYDINMSSDLSFDPGGRFSWNQEWTKSTFEENLPLLSLIIKVFCVPSSSWGALKGHIRTISDTLLYLHEYFSEIRNLNSYRFKILLWSKMWWRRDGICNVGSGKGWDTPLWEYLSNFNSIRFFTSTNTHLKLAF